MRDERTAAILEAKLKSASETVVPCKACGNLPTVTYGASLSREHPDGFNVGHRCPDGTVSRGAFHQDVDAVINEWNRQQA